MHRDDSLRSTINAWGALKYFLHNQHQLQRVHAGCSFYQEHCAGSSYFGIDNVYECWCSESDSIARDI